MLTILTSLREQGLLETFLPWDFDALFVSTTVLVLIRFFDSASLPPSVDCLDKAFALFDYMIAFGNDIAAHRVRELKALEDMLEGCGAASVQREISRGDGEAAMSRASTHLDPQLLQRLGQTEDIRAAEVEADANHGIRFDHAPTDGGTPFALDLSAEQILAMADGMDIEDTEWMNLVLCEPGFCM